jgi:hypothetical protein
MAQISHHKIASIDIGITLSKVNVTGALNVRVVPAYYLEQVLSQSSYFTY